MVKKLFKHYDYSIIVAVLLLTGFGLIMVYSSSTIWSVIQLKKASDFIFLSQLKWTILALIAGFFGLIIPYKMYKALVKPILFGTLALLIMVLLIGQVHNHAQSWFSIGSFNIQPAEIAKLAVIIYLASVFSNKQAFISEFKSSVLPPLIMISLIFLLIAIQPDLGSAMIVAGISGAVILCSGIRVKHVVMLLILAGIALGAIFTFSLTSEQANRLATYSDPFAQSQEGGLQLINSYIAIASGGLTGKGLGNSIEKAGYLPEPHTDFIVAIIAEELGVIGVLFILICIGYFVVKGIYTGIRCQDVFGSLLAIGISSFIGIQTLINLCVATGLLPNTGVTLPFISYGGSSLIMTMFSAGILINITGFVRLKEKAKQEEAA
ncbi:FtsW/RodA/SpoVE family cell cycle protein [Camelliibacillus cellulosilyticus]|uniref:Probable peptidoglycan glycosyltransferase FtsW n=1 Tax=Camelliibacillus cellulosilyticus TaxID=2174486 RepID=A0ABV9GKN7_9BACL